MASANEMSPMSDGSNVIRFSEVAPPDAIDLLSEATEQLNATLHESGLRLGVLIDLVERADHRGAAHLRELTRRFLAGSGNADPKQQIRIWEAVTTYLAQLSSAYCSLVRQFQTYGPGWAVVGDRLPVVIARALRATGGRMKWMRLRYQPFAPDIWKTLSQLCSYIEDKGLMRSRVFVYDDFSTLQRELTRPLMFAMSAADSLPVREIDMVEKLIAHLAGRFCVQRHPARGFGFVLDIDRWTMPVRHRRGDEIRLGARFFGPGDAIADLELLSAQLAAGDISNDDVNLDGVADQEDVINVMAHLERHWSFERPERRGQREQVSSSMAVILDYAEIMQRVAGRHKTAAVDEGAVEFWGLDNESDAGLGALVPAERGEQLGIGGLVGMRAPDTQTWVIGVIRRLGQRDAARRCVGIELLARGVQTVDMCDAGSGERLATGLMLPSPTGRSADHGEVRVLLPERIFSADRALDMTVFDKRYRLQPLMVTESGENFEVGRFHIDGGSG
ncbi:MAG TPA: hypothetical protein VMW70_08720 [Burkholderiales bacterium]|nr:hypothetical protein [Burkholderiales bacterium]